MKENPAAFDPKSNAHLICGQIYAGSQIDIDILDRSSWQYEALRQFSEKVSDDAFPCLFSKKAWETMSLRLLFCEKRTDGAFVHFLSGMLQYTEFVRVVPIESRLFSPLIVFFDDAFHEGGAQHDTAWQALNWLHRNDPLAWPKDVPQDPDDPDWCYCFNDTQLFINISSASHQKLRSRNLGDALTFVINPRKNFDAVASLQTKSGRLVRERIRARIKSYNGGYVPGELGFYGDEDNREWAQYQLEEENLPSPKSCPLRIRDKSKGINA